MRRRARGDLEQIVVTATRLPTRAFDVPMLIYV